MTNAHLLKGVLPYAPDAAPGATPAFAAPPQSDSPVGRVPLEAVLCSGELARRAARQPDYEAENRALAQLVQALADSPASIFQTLSDTLLHIFQVDSAGISLLTKDEKSFCCHAVAGMWHAHAGGATPRHFSPCGDVFDCNTPLLFTHFERRYTYLATMPCAQECLMLPFYVNGQAVGTIWVVAHDARRTFDAEDLRQLTSLGGFASAAFQASQALNSALEQDRTLLGLKQELVEARQAIEKLRESEEHYRMRFESVEEGFCVIEKVEGDTLDFRYVGVNSTFTAQTNLKDVLGKTLRQVLPDEFEERIRIYDAVVRTGEPIRVQREFGDYGRTLELYAFRLGDKAQRRVAINFQDITERKQAEALTACQAAELASLYATAPVGLFMFDTNLRFVRVNQVMAHLNGLPAEQHIGRTLRDLLAKNLADATEPMLRQVLETGLPVVNCEVHGGTTPRPNEQRHWLVNCHPVRAEDGTIRGVRGAVHDITERKQAEEALRESQGFLRSSLDALSGHIAVLDESGTILEVNEAWCRFALENQATSADVGVGVNYVQHCLQHCQQALLQGGEEPAYFTGIKDVIAGRRTRFEIEYECHSPTSQHWFVMRVTRFQNPGPVRVIIVHDECTERKLAEAASHENEERYRNLFNSIDEGFCIIKIIFDEQHQAVDCRFLEVNPAFATQTGAHDITGKRLREILPGIEVGWLKICGQVARTGESIRFVAQDQALEGRWFDIYATRIGRPESPKVAIVFSNITQRIRVEEALRQSEHRFRALFDLGPIAMYSCDTRGVIQEFNRGVVKLWGREPTVKDIEERFFGASKAYRSDGTLLTAAQNPMMAVLNGEIPQALDVEAVIKRPDGAYIRVIANIVPLKNANGDITGAINCVYDITERSRLERETQQQAQALSDLHRRKDEFLAMLSHELRNPLAPLASAVHMLQLQKNEEPLQQHARKVIERQVAQLKRLIDDLLEISRITNGNVRLRPEGVSVSDIVAHALETTQPLIAQRRHELTVSLPPQPLWLHADATRLEQVLVNLLTNAIKYTDEGGRIWLSVALEDDVAPKAGTQVAVLRVRDNGIGISPELLPHIFDIFTQAERTIDRSEGGLGIGLRLVQQLVELHAGTVNVHSVPGQGSEFVVRLPVTPPPSVPLPLPIPPLAHPRKSLRVLAVDDHVDAVQNLALLLEIAGHEVQLAYDGPSALEAAQAMRPDVMLLDIGLPGLTGYEVAQRIRQQPALKDIVLVALTGYGREADRKRSKTAGFDYHLVKPAGFGEVEEILARVAQQLA